jgi:hypothetical protein
LRIFRVVKFKLESIVELLWNGLNKVLLFI